MIPHIRQLAVQSADLRLCVSCMEEISFIAHYGPVTLAEDGTLELARRRPEVKTAHTATGAEMQKASVSLYRMCPGEHWSLP